MPNDLHARIHRNWIESQLLPPFPPAGQIARREGLSLISLDSETGHFLWISLELNSAFFGIEASAFGLGLQCSHFTLCNFVWNIHKVKTFFTCSHLSLEWFFWFSPSCFTGISLDSTLSGAAWGEVSCTAKLWGGGGGGETCPSVTLHRSRTWPSLTVTLSVIVEVRGGLGPISGGNLSQAGCSPRSPPGSAGRESPRPARPAAAGCRPSWCRWSSGRRLGWSGRARPRWCAAAELLASSGEASGRAKHSRRSKTRSCLAAPSHLKEMEITSFLSET